MYHSKFADDESKSAHPIAHTASDSNFGVESRGEGWIITAEKHEHITYLLETLKSLNISSDITKLSKNVVYIERRYCGCDVNTCDKLLERLRILNDINEYKGNTNYKRKKEVVNINAIKPNSQAFLDIVNNIKRMKR
tara:strand:+ start:465 stop:875 length:411 start_codon:yes stop_codon:yes gene_type:complete